MGGKGKGKQGGKKKPPRRPDDVLDFGSPGEGPHGGDVPPAPIPPPGRRLARRSGAFGRPLAVGGTTVIPVAWRLRVEGLLRVDRPLGVYVIDGSGHTRFVPAIDVVLLAVAGNAVAALVLVLLLLRRRRRRG